ncbi:MAG: hypothetical protein V1720_12905 [bacterium]
MIRKILVFIFLFIVVANFYAQDRGFGAGIILGEPTGLSAKYWFSENNAFDFGLGYSLVKDHGEFSFHFDYLYHLDEILHTNILLPVYYGFGFRYRAEEHSESSFGVRGVVGIAWLSNELPIDIFAEVAPVFKLLPETNLAFDAGIGIRYFFY